jgi:hypothetical protein
VTEMDCKTTLEPFPRTKMGYEKIKPESSDPATTTHTRQASVSSGLRGPGGCEPPGTARCGWSPACSTASSYPSQLSGSLPWQPSRPPRKPLPLPHHYRHHHCCSENAITANNSRRLT